MEVNRDEAERCIDIALASLKNGDMERAEKFLRKADNLFPTQKAKDIATLIQRTKAQQQSENQSQPRRRKTATESTKTASPKAEPTNEPVNYTKDQLEMVKGIKRCKDYYEVLGVTKESTDTEIKKAYKKLALQLHPDKNNAPGAVEAFKAVGNAVAVLTDVEKRKTYDLYGSEQATLRTHNHNYANHEYDFGYGRGGFESDFTAEELFNMFFGNGFPQQRAPTANNRRYQQHRHETQQPSLALGLILMLIVISMLSSFFTSDPVYSLTQTAKYSVRRHTIHLNVPYFVKDKFDQEYQGSVARLENSVEEEYIVVMKQACFRERTYREVMMARARSYGSKVHLEQAQSLKTPSCDNLAKIGFSKYLQY